MGGDPGLRGGDLLGSRQTVGGCLIEDNGRGHRDEDFRLAVFSLDKIHRYLLTIDWSTYASPAHEGKPLMVLAMNPSTADAFQNDPTVRRMIGFAKAWGHSGLIVSNVMSYRSTDPKALPKSLEEAVGPMNGRWIESYASCAGMVLAAYGALKGMHAEAAKIAEGHVLLVDKPIYRLSSKPYPRHPLYARGSDTPELWRTPHG
jgi:hypothetical protein